MQHLIIHAHPSKHSFSNHLKNALDEKSTNMGLKTIVRDLYGMEFNPVLSPDDLDGSKKGNTPADIAYEQKLIAQSDLITVIFPLWWAGFPAILKGYIDRVFSYGFAYRKEGSKVTGLLKGKQVVLLSTMGNTIEEYEEKGLLNSFRHVLGSEIFSFCGMDIVQFGFFPQIPDSSEMERQKYIHQVLEFYRKRWAVTNPHAEIKDNKN